MSKSNFLSVANLKTFFKTVSTKRKAVTESVVWHSLRHNNVSFFTGCDKAISAELDSTLRVLVPVKWDDDKAAYVFDSKKQKSVMKKLGLDKGFTEVELLAAFEKFTGEKAASTGKKELSLEEKQKRIQKKAADLITEWADLGLSMESLEAMLNLKKGQKELAI